MGRRFLTQHSPRKAYRLGLALIAILVTLQFFGLRIATAGQKLSAIEINLSGRQRMLSQRVAWIMSSLSEQPHGSTTTAYLRGLLGTCADLMARSYLALQSKELGLMSSALSSGTTCLAPDPEVVLALPKSWTQVTEPDNLARLLDSAKAMALGESATAASADGQPPPLLTSLLSELDQQTLSAQRDSISQLNTLLSINWVLILLLVVGEIVLIFRPMSVAVETAMRKLKQSNDELTRSEHRLQDFARTGAHQLWETDSEFRFLWVGASDPDVGIVDDSNLLGFRLWELAGIDIENDAAWDKLKARVAERRGFMSFEYASADESGGTRWWRMHGRPIFTESGEFTGYRGTTQEITKEHQLAVDFRRAERMRAIGQLTAGVAHDFNNLLMVIQGNTELVLSDAHGSHAESMREVLAATHRGATLTSRLLAFGQAQKTEKESVALRPFLLDLEKLLVRTLGQTIRIQIDLPERPLSVFVDRHQFEDACLNLALNARDAVASDGLLRISAATPLLSDIDSRHSADRHDQLIKVTFSDNGRGTPQHLSEKIFEPFFTTRVSDGSGLGLSMVYGFVNEAGGHIEVRSEMGAGTTFELYLPKGVIRLENGARTLGPRLTIPPDQRALLVEDNDAIRRVMTQQLESMGVHVTTASDGAEAIDLLRHETRYDILVLDIVLPGHIAGTDVHAFAAGLGSTPGVLFCSGFAGSVGNESDEFASLPGPLLRKPFSVDEFEQAIAEVLAARAVDRRTTHGA